jgi:hypothetical protein
MAALTHTRFAALALWYYAFRGAPGDADYQIDLKVPRQHRSVKINVVKPDQKRFALPHPLWG